MFVLYAAAGFLLTDFFCRDNPRAQRDATYHAWLWAARIIVYGFLIIVALLLLLPTGSTPNYDYTPTSGSATTHSSNTCVYEEALEETICS